MKKIYISILAINFCFLVSSAQPAGEWTWMKGNASLNYSTAVFGTKGVASASNTPGSYYESCEWKDSAGNFWIYGGLISTSVEMGDLWKFDPITTNWTWQKGPGVQQQLGVYGIQGVPSPTNQPGCRAWGMVTWVGVDKKLWMYGGYGYGASGAAGFLNDLWNYDVATDQWTWISGGNITNAVGVYGTKGVPSAANIPGARCEINTGWQDSTGNLWLFGGDANGGRYNDLWKFDISTLQWTWMHGASGLNSTGSFGFKGISTPANEPPARYVYGRWKDLVGNFWMFGGSSSIGSMNDLWKYDPNANEWVWVNGPNTGNGSAVNGAFCAAAATNVPASKYENRASWTDHCGNFYNFGGYTPFGVLNDFWQYNPTTDQWRLINGTTTATNPGNYGSMGVSSPANVPPSRFGADAWTDANGNFWMFGGRYSTGTTQLNDVWRYVLDTACLGISCSTSCALKADFTSSDTTFCDETGKCIDFFDHSACNPTSWQWIFAGATPSTSALQNPTGICYYYPGTYEVKLIVNNGVSSDTLDVLPHIIFGIPAPPPTIVVVGGDTLVSSHCSFYQWYLNGLPIAGATDSFYFATQAGLYSVQGTDILGCVANSNGITMTGLSAFDAGDGVILFPNPVSDELIISVPDYILREHGGEAVITDIVGNELSREVVNKDQNIHSISVKELSNGIYVLRLSLGAQTINKKFVVLHR